MYVLDGTADRQPDEALVAAQLSSDLWHQRLAHVNDKVLEKLVSCDVSGVDLKKVEPRSFCEGCVLEMQPGTSQSLWERFVQTEDWRRCIRMYVARCKWPPIPGRNIW